MTSSTFLLSTLLLVLIAASGSIAQTVYLTVGYCPTLTTGAGAVVAVDSSTGDYTIVGQFKWPPAIFGCTVDYDPIVTLDSASETVYLYFGEVQIVVAVSLGTGSVSNHIASGSMFWTGFENMLYQPSDNLLAGMSADVTENGYCSDGCFQYGQFSIDDGKYKKFADVPFKALLDDSHYSNSTSQVFYVQASYDLRQDGERCAPNDADECLLAIDETDGTLLSSNYTEWTVYKYSSVIGGPDGVSVLAWIEGFDSLCKHPYNDFLFGWVNLKNASVEPIACIPHSVTVAMDEWIASFTPDGSLFATGSGDSETGIPQLLIFDPSNGALMLNSSLPGLGAKLGSKDGLFDVWSVDFLSN